MLTLFSGRRASHTFEETLSDTILGLKNIIKTLKLGGYYEPLKLMLNLVVNDRVILL